MQNFEDVRKFINDKSNTDLRCSLCCKLLSVPPIIYTSTQERICGRCRDTAIITDAEISKQVVYESFAKLFYFPCCYHELGCKAELQWDQVKEHEAECDFKNSACPLAKHDYLCLDEACTWSGHNRELFSHIESEHKKYFIKPPLFTLKDDKACNLFFTQVSGHTAMIITKYIESLEKYYCFVLMRLDQQECFAFHYQLEINDGNKTNSVILRKNKVSPLSEFILNAISNPEEGLEIDLNYINNVLKKPVKIFVKCSIVKKNKKEIGNLNLSRIVDTQPDRALMIDEKVLQEIECPVCNEYMISPIFICQTGHSVCHQCSPKVEWCPSCRSEMLGSRNFTLEKITSLVNYPCKNRINGCYFVTTSDKIRNHEANCSLSGKQCVLKCAWKGTTIDMIIHMQNNHQDFLIEPNQERIYEIKSNTKRTNRVLCFNNDIFLFTILQSNKRLLFTVECLGMEKDQYTYGYNFQIYHASNKKLKLSMSQICQPLNIADPLAKNKTCVEIPLALLEPYMSEQKVIQYKVGLIKL